MKCSSGVCTSYLWIQPLLSSVYLPFFISSFCWSSFNSVVNVIYFYFNRYIFCDDFFGEESIFYEIFAGNFLSVSLFFCDDFNIVSIAVTDLLWYREDIRNILSTSVQIVEPFLARWYDSSTFFLVKSELSIIQVHFPSLMSTSIPFLQTVLTLSVWCLWFALYTTIRYKLFWC